MRVRVVETEIEGSLKEITRYLKGKVPQPGITQPIAPAEVAPLPLPVPSGDPLTVDVAKKTLTRHPVAANHLKMLRAIYTAHPKKVPISGLCQKLGLTERQMKGVIGSFRRRLNQVLGHGNDTIFLMHNNTGYGLTDAARSALEELKLVQAPLPPAKPRGGGR